MKNKNNMFNLLFFIFAIVFAGKTITMEIDQVFCQDRKFIYVKSNKLLFRYEKNGVGELIRMPSGKVAGYFNNVLDANFSNNGKFLFIIFVNTLYNSIFGVLLDTNYEKNFLIKSGVFNFEFINNDKDLLINYVNSTSEIIKIDKDDDVVVIKKRKPDNNISEEYDDYEGKRRKTM